MKTRAQAASILRTLERQHPDADTELVYRNAFELLVATILSAQTTDAGVNSVTPQLFERYPDARALAGANPADVEPIVLKTGFFRQKTKSIIGMARALLDRHEGEVPATMEALTRLPGVGRKTANVVLAHALGVPGLPVDRHVLRVANRLGLASSDDPEVVEQQLGDVYPPASWRVVSDTFILHGRRVCNPKPLCDRCPVREDCDYYGSLAAAGPGAAKPTRKGRGAAIRLKPAPTKTPPAPTKSSRSGRRPASSKPRRGEGEK